jgi:hypothetical protein
MERYNAKMRRKTAAKLQAVPPALLPAEQFKKEKKETTHKMKACTLFV